MRNLKFEILSVAGLWYVGQYLKNPICQKSIQKPIMSVYGTTLKKYFFQFRKLLEL